MTTLHISSNEEQTEFKTILIVEDDEDIGELIIITLQDEGYHVVLVTDGFQALKIIHTLKPNLFLLDYNLPDMNGLELYDQLHAKNQLETVPVLFMSAKPPCEAFEARQVSFLEKPFELDDVIHIVEHLLET